MRKIELLAPAGSMESLQAAVQNGADAVYLGGEKFSARAYASNFNEEKIIEAVEYCHLYNVKIYVTLNILIKEEEISKALEYVKFLYEARVDALIIQDLGIAKLIKENFPDFEIHASTQMTIHNGEGALLLTKAGFKRIVLARELSLNEIRYISKDLSIETEVFIHGALCICYSGQCLMSSLIGGRSGNRGRCAQPCRLPYDIINKKNKEVKKGYLLSPKDICNLENIGDVIESGVSSIKIEGRMKRPEYVAGVVSAYRKAIDSFYDKSHLKDKINLELEKKKLLQLFNREGFSKAYLYGNTGKEMMSYRFPGNAGVRLGKINKDFTLKLEENINLQDAVRIEDEGFTVQKIEQNSINVEEAFKGDSVKLKPVNYKPGDVLYKILDIKLMEELKKSYNKTFEKKHYIDLNVKFQLGEPLTLTATYGGKVYEAQGETVQKPLKKPVDKESLIKNLNKTGDTPFAFKNINFHSLDEGFIPISSINACRRELIEKIWESASSKEKRSFKGKVSLKIGEKRLNPKETDNPLVVVSKREQLKAIREFGIENIAIDLFMRNCDIDLEQVKLEKLYIRVPTIVKGEFHIICNLIEENITRLRGIITSNLGIIKKFSNKTRIIGDYKLNIFNAHSLDFYKDLIDAATISLELNKKEIKDLLSKAPMPSYQIIYGKPELMVSEYCPIGSMFGGKENKECSCKDSCNKGEFILKDRKGAELPVLTDKFCRSHIYNPSPINLISNLDELEKIKSSLFRLDFTDENYEETLEIMKAYMERSFQKDFRNYTRGHFKRGVE